VGIREVWRRRFYGLIAESLKPLAHAAELELGALLADRPNSTAAERAIWKWLHLVDPPVPYLPTAKATVAAASR
jgi:hypothetical protein